MQELYGGAFWRKMLVEHPNKMVLIGDPVFDGSDIIDGEFLGEYDDEVSMCKDYDKFVAEGRNVMWRGTGPDPSILFIV